MLETGSSAPSFRLKDHAGATHDLADYRGRWVVLYFYPKDDTPGCTTEACSFRDNLARLEAHGAAVLAMSADDEKAHGTFAKKYDLNFPLLVDPDTSTLEAYGAWVEKKMYGKSFMGVPRVTYLIDPAGTIAHVWPKVQVEGHVDDVIRELERQRSTVGATGPDPRQGARSASGRSRGPARSGGRGA
jgi:thioredoxin-dependent peroxiredoxin